MPKIFYKSLCKCEFALGSQNDADGNLKNWWDDRTLKNYLEKAACFVEQYSNYSFPTINMTVINFPSRHKSRSSITCWIGLFQVNGLNTQSENIADNGGLRQAYRAFKRFEQKNPTRQKLLPGLANYNSDQLFFLSYAHVSEWDLFENYEQSSHLILLWIFLQIMCEAETEANLIQQIQTGVHTPSRFRVNGALANSVEFAKAWNCPVPSARSACHLW